MHFGRLFRNATIKNVLIPNGSIGINNIDNRVKVIVDGKETRPEEVQYHHPNESERVIYIKVNRPFLFYIIDMETRVPYFSGVVTNFGGKGVVDHSTELESDKEFVPRENCRKVDNNDDVAYDDYDY